MDEYETWRERLREKRLTYGVTQKELASAVGISEEYLNRIERGKKTVSEDMQKTIDNTLEKFNPDCPLEVLFDYVRLRFPTQDVKRVSEIVLQMKFARMFREDYGFYGYTEQYKFGDIVLMMSGEEDKERGTLLELKGKGCRQFEHILAAQKRSWYDFFMSAITEQCVFKRIDLAINDKPGILSIPELARKCEQDECVSVFRSFQGHKSGDFLRSEILDDKLDMGNTLYIGSMKSDVYFCIYEKDYEQYKKEGIPIEDAEVKNRFEIRLKNDRAQNAVVDLLCNENPEKTAMEIINRYIRFVDRAEDKAPQDWPYNERWLRFIGKGRSQLRLTTKPEPYNFQRSLAWISKQVVPTLKMALTLDIMQDTDYINDMIKHTELSERHKRMLEQMDTPVDDVIIPSLDIIDNSLRYRRKAREREGE